MPCRRPKSPAPRQQTRLTDHVSQGLSAKIAPSGDVTARKVGTAVVATADDETAFAACAAACSGGAAAVVFAAGTVAAVAAQVAAAETSPGAGAGAEATAAAGAAYCLNCATRNVATVSAHVACCSGSMLPEAPLQTPAHEE